ncbi:MAG: molybdenum cofactor biosynthesis protein MoaE [Rhodospirillaceae bacterium]|nr:molybdenum cofactor biosynthesis protein MoaE [Rhodospirillales bacterium]
MIRVQAEDFDPGAEIDRFTQGNTKVGGICMFLGLVRDFADNADVHGMTLEHYPGMTEKQLEAIEVEARRRWPLEDALIIHRYGRLDPGARIVLVATASAHREAAFQSCHFLIDWLKTRAPFWKIEHTMDGDQWVAAKDSDDTAATRWDEVPNGDSGC